MVYLKHRKFDLLFGSLFGLSLYATFLGGSIDFYQELNGTLKTFVKVLMVIIIIFSVSNAFKYLDLDTEITLNSRLIFLSSGILVFSILFFLSYTA